MLLRTRKYGRPGIKGFTLTELLVGSTLMLVVVVATLALYVRSNKIAVDHSQYAELQQDVRSAMYIISRDVRMAGVGLPFEFSSYFIEGWDNEDQSADVTPDRLRVMGNMEDPLNLRIDNYQGAAANLALYDYSFEENHYADTYYDNKVVLIIPNPSSPCRAGEVRQITHVSHSQTGSNEKLNFSPGLAPGIDPPGGLSGTCPDSDNYDGGWVTFIEVKEYWLDVTGNYPGLTAGQDGYIGNGQGGILYMTMNALHYALAQNVENLQFEYCGDMNDDGLLDGFVPWDSAWTIDQVNKIRQVRIQILGRTGRPFLTVSGEPPATIHLYQRPAISNHVGNNVVDLHKRFLLESVSNVRNLTVNVYNTGTR